MKKLTISTMLLLSIFFSPVAFAGDGVLEINQTCATELGCFSGDTPGFPVTINGAAGFSYRLTSNLVIPDTNTHGISVAASHISIDLNGFAIIGTACVGSTTDCTPASGGGHGISISLTSISGISVFNGSIIGMGNRGLSLLGDSHSVRGVQARWNRSYGIFVQGSSLVINSRSNYNGSIGIVAGVNSIVRDSTASSNASHGINVANESIVINNTTQGNTSSGIQTGSSVKVSGNVSVGNSGNGITTSQSSIVQGNNVNNNAGYGIRMLSQSMYLGNLVVGNSAGTISTLGSVVNMGTNSCNGTATCP